ncbi:UNVERIFIED_CONTAM: hypothetical protein K2H54_013583 [Gekko kuhli]
MDADIDRLVLDLLMACATARAQRQRCLEAIQRWEEVLIASRRRRYAAWARFLIIWRVRARQRQAQGRRNIRNLLHLAERMPGRHWWLYLRSTDWWKNFVSRIWGEEQWLENFRISRPKQKTLFGISQPNQGGCQPQRARGRRLDPHRTLEAEAVREEEEEQASIQISSGTEGDAGEGQLPGPAPGPQQGHDRRRSSWEKEMVEMRRTLKRYTYRLCFIHRSTVKLRQMVQQSQGIGQQQQRRRRQRRRRRQDPLQAPRPSSPLASMAEGMLRKRGLWRVALAVVSGWLGSRQLLNCVVAVEDGLVLCTLLFCIWWHPES